VGRGCVWIQSIHSLRFQIRIEQSIIVQAMTWIYLQARTRIEAGKIKDARSCYKKAADKLPGCTQDEECTTTRVGERVRICRLNPLDPHNGNTGIIKRVEAAGEALNLDDQDPGLSTDSDLGLKVVMGQRSSAPCLYVALDRSHPQALLCMLHEVENPVAELVRLDERIASEERRVLEREMELKRRKEERREQERNKKTQQACKEILLLLRSGDDAASVEVLKKAVEDEILDRISIQAHICSGIHQLTRRVRLKLSSKSFINDQKYCPIFEVLIPHLSEDSLRQALDFAAKRSGIQHSQYRSYYPLLKPLLKGLPGVKFKRLAISGHGRNHVGVHGASCGEHLDLPILATIKHGGEFFFYVLPSPLCI
jgi:hypothetical protein